ncbi:glycosyltransferase family 4 protein [Geminicoccus harenae]|uniref:glycosyltransferase family 4 protein n=1 Tax=Geminicoccus harenae TaxID=2498453 RepID=UPI00168B66E6|nr:glycosyltransferase family 1 protein [Geminicoccus harenae]
MHIGFDVSQTGAGKAGCGYFADAMARALVDVAPEHSYAFYPSFGDFYLDPKIPARNPYPGRAVHYGPRFLTRESAAAFWNAARLEQALHHPDIIHANNFWCPTQVRQSRVVYTLHDLGFTIQPDWTTEANRVGCFDGVVRAAAYADWIIAVSDASRRHFLKLFPFFPEDRVAVVHPCSRFHEPLGKGVAPKSMAHVEPGAFWLSVGTIEPRKNQIRLAEAYAAYLRAGGPAMPLVFAGGEGWLMNDFHHRLEELGIASNVICTGYVSDENLVWLYRNCYANLYPSLFEGFGLPILEGMQFGAPTISSNSSSLPEVGGDAALLLDPEATEAWTAAMLMLARDRTQRERMSADAIARSALFDGVSSARKLEAVYQAALAQPKRQIQTRTRG